MLAGFQNPLFLLGVPPAVAAPGLGFRFAYRKACAEIRRTLEDLLDAAEEGPPQEEEPPDRGDRPPGQIRRSEEHTSELQSRQYLVCRLLLEKKQPLTPLPYPSSYPSV